MYSNCKEAHVAVLNKIQQINANRQESIRPQYIDIALNEAIDVLLTQKIKAFEETGRYYDDLKVLKRTTNLKLNLIANDHSKGFSFLPGDYLYGVSYEANIVFDKFHKYRHVSKNGVYLRVIPIINLFDTLPIVKPLELTIGNQTINIEFNQPIRSIEGIFQWVNTTIQILRDNGYNVTYERFSDYYFPKSIVICFYENVAVSCNNGIVVKSIDSLYNTFDRKYEVITSNGTEELIKETNSVGMDLVSDVEKKDILQTYHNAKNRHLHPICTMGNQMLMVYMNDSFIVDSIDITYLKEPVRFDIVNDRITELPFKTEIINLAVQKLLGILKDEGYQVAINENVALK